MYKIFKFYAPDFNAKEYWEDKYAKEHIAGRDAEDFRKQGFWPLLAKQLKKDGTYLDAGSGVGGWVVFLHEEGYQVAGIDEAARTIRALTEYNPDLHLKIAPIVRIPHPNASFDGVLAIGTLEYIEEQLPQALKEVNRVLRPGGWFFLEVPYANTLRRFFYMPLKRLQYMVYKRLGYHPTFAHYFMDQASLTQLLDQAGFTVSEVAPHELPDSGSHYGLYVDWRIFRGAEPYQLNVLGRLVKAIANTISPWVASTGMVVVARKQ